MCKKVSFNDEVLLKNINPNNRFDIITLKLKKDNNHHLIQAKDEVSTSV